MSADIQALEQNIETFRVDIGKRFDRVHDDLKELTKALRDLIRLDGDIRRLQDALGRIGRANDDHEARLRTVEKVATVSTDHEGRLRAVEDAKATALVQTRHLDRRQWLITTTAAALLSSAISGLLVFYLTH